MEKLALVMAAGEGTRMLSSTPKTLHKACGMPIIEHVLRSLHSLIDEVIVIVGHGKEQVMGSCAGQAAFVEQKSGGWGTGYAVMSAMDKLKGRHGQVIVTGGDIPLVLPETYAMLLRKVEEGNACAMLTEIMENPFGYGRVVRENSKVKAIVEQKDLVGEQLNIKEMNASVYCFDIDALLGALPKLSCQNAANEYYLTDVIRLLSDEGQSVVTVPVLEKAESMGINDRVQLAQAEAAMRRRVNNRLMRSGVTLIDPDTTYIHANVTIGQDTVIHPGCFIENGSIIGTGCTIRASRISNARVGNNARVEQSVVIDAVIDAGVRVGPFEHIMAGRKISASNG